MNYRPEVDGLRAVAVIPVVLFHAGLPLFRGGFVGVDIFFVISGYLITRILAGETERGDFSFMRFYERRARRILPALFTVLACCAATSWLILTPEEMKIFSESAGAVALFVSNMYLMRSSGYFLPSAELMPLLHTWSLAVEEQFYIVMPFIVLLLPKMRKRRFVTLLAGIAIASFLLAIVMLRRGMISEAFYLMPTRAWELLAGSLSALIPVRRNPGLALAGLAAILIAILTFSKATPTPSWPIMLPVIGTAMVLRHATHDTITGRILAWQPLVWVGILSYSTYLWHQPIFAYAKILLGNPSLPVMLALAGLSLAISWPTWRFVETPTRKGIWWPWESQRKVLTASAAGLMMIRTFADMGYQSDGFAKQRVDPRQLALIQTARPSPLRERCHADGGTDSVGRACILGGSNASWAVLGDSHGVELSYALAQRLQPMGIGLREYTYSACGPKFSAVFPSDPCVDWHRSAVHKIAGNAEIKTVIIVYRLNLHLIGSSFTAGPDVNETESRIWSSYLDEIRFLHAAGKKVVVVTPIPELPRPVDQILFWGIPNGSPSTGASWAEWKTRNNFLLDRIHDLSIADSIVDPAETFCEGQNCFAAKDGQALYFDSNHPSVSGAGLIADVIVAQRFAELPPSPDLDVSVTGGGNL